MNTNRPTNTAESRNAEEPKQNPQGQEQEPKLSQQEEDQEKFQQLVEDLFDSYDVKLALEEAAVISLVRALWMKRTHNEFNSDTRRLDQEINTALMHLTKSKALRKRKDPPNPTIGILGTRRNNSRCGLIRRPVEPKMRARPRCPIDTLKLLVPVAAAIDPDPDLTRGSALIRKKWSDGRGLGLTPEEEGELHAIKGSRFPSEQDARRQHELAEKSTRTPDEEIELAKLVAQRREPLADASWMDDERRISRFLMKLNQGSK